MRGRSSSDAAFPSGRTGCNYGRCRLGRAATKLRRIHAWSPANTRYRLAAILAERTRDRIVAGLSRAGDDDRAGLAIRLLTEQCPGEPLPLLPPHLGRLAVR